MRLSINFIKVAFYSILFGFGQPVIIHSWAEDETHLAFINRGLWTNTRLVGTPEPPPPYKAVPIYTNQVWRSPMFLAAEPQTKRLLALLHHGQGEPTQLVAFKDDPKVICEVSVWCTI